MNIRTRLLILEIIVVLGACGFFFYFGLGAFGLVGADEPRYAQIARERLARHDWIVPTLNGSPWLGKPVLLYWKAMGSYMMYGVYDWAARLPAATYATGMVLAIFFFMRRFRAGSELDAALIAASMAGILAFARAASTDMMISAPLCVAMLAWWTWHRGGKRLWLAAFYVLLAVGMLAKGPVAPALAVMIVAAYAIVRRDGKIFLRSLWWPGFLLFFAIALPWYVAVQMKVPQFVRIFFIEHNLERFGTNLYQHSQPFWYYIPVFLLSVLPWTVFTIMGIVNAGADSLRQFRGEKHTSQDDDGLQSFLLIWILVPIVFFSVSRSKLPGYILPAIPAAAVLTADYLHRAVRPLNRWTMMVHSLICGLLLGAALFAPSRMLKVRLGESAQSWIFVGAGLIAILVLLVVRFGGQRVLNLATLIPVIAALAFLLGPAAPVIDEVSSARTVDARLRELKAPEVPIAVFNVKRDVEYGLNFYRNEPISRYERNEIPAQRHVVIVKEGNAGAVQAVVGQRQVSKIGDFPPQHLEFFLVSK